MPRIVADTAYARNVGLTIDHMLLSPSIGGRLEDVQVYLNVRGWEKAGDHAPTWTELGEDGKWRRRC